MALALPKEKGGWGGRKALITLSRDKRRGKRETPPPPPLEKTDGGRRRTMDEGEEEEPKIKMGEARWWPGAPCKFSR